MDEISLENWRSCNSGIGTAGGNWQQEMQLESKLWSLEYLMSTQFLQDATLVSGDQS